jgi:hypothetical protein
MNKTKVKVSISSSKGCSPAENFTNLIGTSASSVKKLTLTNNS